LPGKNQPFPEALWEGLSAFEKKNFDPIAADARPSSDGNKLAKLKLISGMLGVELDSLIQREARRKQNQISILAGIFTVATLVLSVLLYVATEARKEAEASRLEAEERQFQAEALVEFMLGDLRTKLEPIGNLQIMDTIAIQALGYYASIDPEEMSVDALSRRSEVLLMLGEIESQRGHPEQAQSAFMEAFSSTEEMLARDPENPDRIFDHSQSVFWLAATDLRQGNLSEAEEKFQLYSELSATLAQKDPENLDYQIEVGYAHSNLGTLYFNQGRFSEAEKEFQDQLEVFQGLAEKDPTPGAYDEDLAQSYAWLASSQLGLGKLQLARDQRLKELKYFNGLLEANPNNYHYQQALVVTHQSLGAIFSLLGDEKTALPHFKKGMEIGETLVAFDPENTLTVEYLAQLILDKMEILGPKTGAKEAQLLIIRLKNLTQFLLDRDAMASDWVILDNRASLVEANYLINIGKIKEGLAVAELANTSLLDLRKAEKENYNIWAPLGLSALVLAEGYGLTNQPEKEMTTLKTFIQLAEQNETKLTIRAHDFLARAFLKIGDLEKAKQKREFLTKIGYNAPDFQFFWRDFEN